MINPGIGYRLLQPGETIAEGDEYHSTFSDTPGWVASKWAGRKVMPDGQSSTYRRKIEPQSEPEYRTLVIGDTIKEGDQYLDNHHPAGPKWRVTSRPGTVITEGSYRYRRKVEPGFGYIETKYTVDPGPGYRLLEIGEIIKPDDQRFLNNEWLLVARYDYFKPIVALDYRYRREIEPVITKVECDPKPPPLGLRPRQIACAERLDEIRGAIKRYVTAKKDIPHEWITEYFELVHGDDFMMTL